MSQSHASKRDGFEALMKPIQDIARVDIDLCQSLEEYLSHILSIDVSPVIFAEAALLVQNSAAIYSKKVDFLWSTVIQLLESLGKNKLCKKCCGSDCTTQCQGRRKTSRENGLNNNEEGVEGETANGRRKRPLKRLLQTEELHSIKDICSENSLDLKSKKLDVMNQLVLNVATKVKTDHNVACVIYDGLGNEMGKKDEFRLHWKVASDGLLHEDFVNSHSLSQRTEANYDESIANSMLEITCPDDPMHFDDSFQDNGADIFPTPPEIIEDLPGTTDHMRDDVFTVHECRAEGQLRKGENVVNVEQITKKAWEPVSFDVNMPEKVIRKRNVLKVPEKLQPEKENRKRKRSEFDVEVDSYLTLDWIVKYHIGAVKINRYLHGHELLRVVQAETQLKKQVMRRRRKAFQDIIVMEASKEYEGDFEGFPDMDPDDDDDENGGFNGFSDNINTDCVADDLNVPLPERVDDYNNDREPPNNAYETEALKTLQQYQMDRHKDDPRLSGISERVAAWHQLVLPKLEMAESIAHFDIHEYGSRIINKFPQSGKPGDDVKMFSEIVAGLAQGEVARNYLSSLCLVNTGNLEMTRSLPDPMAMDCLKLRLLSRTRHHEEIHDNMKQNDNS